MSDLRITVDAGRTISFLEASKQQLPFAISVAVNKTAKDVQIAQRAQMQASFIIRKPWVLQGVVISKFSDKSEATPTAVVGIDPTRSFLNKFEQGGQKVAANPALPIAVPTLFARPDRGGLVPLGLYPKNLGLAARRGVTGIVNPKGKVSKRGILQLQGKRRTFVLDLTMAGVQVPGVYQRTGPGPHDFRLLWAYKPSIPIPALLRFEETALKTVTDKWATNFSNAFERALATAK